MGSFDYAQDHSTRHKWFTMSEAEIFLPSRMVGEAGFEPATNRL